jgi:pilus assembly protein Flp/PilA
MFPGSAGKTFESVAGDDRTTERTKMDDLIFKLFVRLQPLMKREEGQNLVEYGLIIALIAFGAAASMKTVGSDISMIYSAISVTVSSALA